MRFSMFRQVTSSTLNLVFGRLRTEGPQYWEALKATNRETFHRKIRDLNSWYTRIIGLDEVKLYQDRVVALQERLLEAQEKRREISRSLAEIRKKSNQLQDEIHKVKRSEDLERFLSLMKEETEVLRLEHDITRQFQESDQTEREIFTAFTNAVRDSHEKQRAQLEYTKYFGIILSITGSFLAFCYTTLRKNDLKKFIEGSLAQRTPPSEGRDNSEIISLIRSETSKISDLIQIRQNEMALLTRQENTKESDTQQILYYIGAGTLILILLRFISS